MQEILDYRLFRIGGAPVTVGSLVACVGILLVSYLLARLARRLVINRLLTHRLRPSASATRSAGCWATSSSCWARWSP